MGDAFSWQIMYKLQETSVEWSLLHIRRFGDSDFFPRQFEFEAIHHSWEKIRAHILGLDLEDYAPKTPEVRLAQKPNGTFRVVHQLDPIDSIIFTALVHENAETIENFRIPPERKIACSYRIKLDDKIGSFVREGTTGYDDYLEKSEELSGKYTAGYVLVCDLVDFYNQIYLHRINNLLDEAGSSSANVLESFLTGLNTNVSQGVPVGPFASILLAELIMADIDKRVLLSTDAFTRYVDDFNIFFDTKAAAYSFLHDLTHYLYSQHRLVLSPEKTKVIGSEDFRRTYLQNDEAEETNRLRGMLAALRTGHYPSYEETQSFDDLDGPEQFKLRVEAYRQHFRETVDRLPLQLGTMRHLLRQAGKYKVRALTPLILDDFGKLLPVLRDVVVYLNRTLTPRLAKQFASQFRDILSRQDTALPYNNLWIYSLLQSEVFAEAEIPIDYSKIHRIRDRALIALRKKDTIWVKGMKNALDTLAQQDRRAVILSSMSLSFDEAKHWLTLEAAKGDPLNTAICAKVISDMKASQSNS
jgi:hypothetical protein